MKREKIKKAIDHRGILIEFKDFALRGNVIDMAVAAVIAFAFGQIVNSFINDILLQIIGSVVKVDFASLSVSINGIHIYYGKFIHTIVNFFTIALIMFIVIKFINLFSRKSEGKDDEDPSGDDESVIK